MPTARAPTPMRRNVPLDVPARCPPSEPCACALAGASSSAAATAIASGAASSPEGRLEVHIELGPPRAAAVVRWVVDRAHTRELVESGEVARVGQAVAPARPPAAVRVDHIDSEVIENVRARDAEVEAPGPEQEPAVDLEVDRELRRRVARVRQPHRVGGAGGDRRERAARLRLRVDVDADLLMNSPVLRRLVVPAHVEARGELARAVPAYELLGQPRLVAAADLLQRLLLVRIAALAARLLVRVRDL